MELRVKGDSLGETIRLAREAANLSQAELATKLGVSARTVQHWETVQYWDAGRTPQPKHRRAIAAFLDGDEEAAA